MAGDGIDGGAHPGADRIAPRGTTAVSMTFLALYLVSGSTTVNSISRPGRSSAYSPTPPRSSRRPAPRRSAQTASARKPSGRPARAPPVSSARHAVAARHAAREEQLMTMRQRLHRGIERAEDLRLLGARRIRVGHQLGLLEVQEGARGGQQDHEQR